MFGNIIRGSNSFRHMTTAIDAVVGNAHPTKKLYIKSEKECYKYNDSEQSFLDETTLLSGKSPFGKGDLGG